MGVILTHGTGGGSASGSGAFSQAQKLALEMEMEFKTAITSYYKELEYITDPGPLKGSLFDVIIWEDFTKTIKIFHKDLFYNSDRLLSKTLLTRQSDGSQLVKFFVYDVSDNLINITVSAG